MYGIHDIPIVKYLGGEGMSDMLMGLTGDTTESFLISVLVRLFCAAICGGIIGFERGLKGRPAGLKPFSLVCIGATMVMVTNEYIMIYVSGGSGDAARMAAQVISGIGFLGAGTIMVTGANQVKGLTTAAALWVTAALGITIGSGFYFGAIAGTVMVCGFSGLYTLFDSVIIGNSRYMKLCIEGADERFMIRLLDFLSERQIQVKNLTRRAEYKWYKKDICAIVELDFGKRQKHQEVLEEIGKIDGIRFIHEI